MGRKAADIAGKEETKIASLFRRHLEEHHNIKSEQDFDQGYIEAHLKGRHTLMPVSIFSNRKLSALEAMTKYLREEERLTNKKTAELLGRSPASIWITYRNSIKKHGKRLRIETSDVFVPTQAVAGSGLSVLESICIYLHEQCGLSYHRIGILMNRDERTVWTVCSRARRKKGR